MSKHQNIFIYLSFILASLVIIATSFFNQSIDQATKNLGGATPRPASNNQASVEILVPSHTNFSLNDPGLLPNHFLYPLKMIKDRVILTLTFNKQKRAQLLFYYSNTRMSAADKLIKQGETGLAVSTATKGQAYMLQAIDNSMEISEIKRLAWFDSLRLSLLKHEEIIEKIRFVAKDQAREQANYLWNQLDLYRLRVTSLSGAPFNYLRPEDIQDKQELEPYL